MRQELRNLRILGRNHYQDNDWRSCASCGNYDPSSLFACQAKKDQRQRRSSLQMSEKGSTVPSGPLFPLLLKGTGWRDCGQGAPSGDLLL